MKLYLVFGLGFLTSLAVVGGLIWVFADYETRDLVPFFHKPTLSQDKWFEVIRNAVTTGTALGVGVTLFFCYRRQQTAEETQRIGAEAQLTAAMAQETAAKALDLSTNSMHWTKTDAVTSELRTRYANTAEQLASSHLAVRLAGIYSLAWPPHRYFESPRKAGTFRIRGVAPSQMRIEEIALSGGQPSLPRRLIEAHESAVHLP